MLTEKFHILRNVMTKEQAVIKFENGAEDPHRYPRFRPAFVEFPSTVKSALRHANNEALKKLIDKKPTNKDDPLLPLMLEEALRLHCQVEALLASLPGDYNQESLQELGLIKPADLLNLTAE